MKCPYILITYTYGQQGKSRTEHVASIDDFYEGYRDKITNIQSCPYNLRIGIDTPYGCSCCSSSVEIYLECSKYKNTYITQIEGQPIESFLNSIIAEYQPST